MNFYETVTAAVNDMLEHGFDSDERLRGWEEKLRRAAVAEMIPERQLRETLESTFRKIYEHQVERGEIARLHPGVDRFTIRRLRPKLRAELDRRIVASANLIRLNRRQSVEKTLQRFSGWATSIPIGGSEVQDRRETKANVGKALKSLPFEERRVAIDQGHKFTAALSNIVATDGGAIAAEWHSNWRQKGYDYRKDHRERDGRVYLIRDSWAQKKGLVKPGPAGYYDRITQAAEEPFCRCWVTYVYAIRSLPDDMVTDRGREELARVRALLSQ